ncbi:MAG: archemetzincin, partial [Candidatus Lokiarchaeota archaeon]|nr:archemetzincin [Candidatus Lokiarchaeota archaeon]
QALFEKRILKEAIHELGHTFNLKHCKSKCVMQFSESLYEADKKPLEYCSTCKKHLRYFLSTL